MKPIVLGLTGSIGMGKSTVAQMFRDEGVPVFCGDSENHKMRGPHGAALPIYEEFVPGSTNPETGTNMDMIKAFIYADPANLEALTDAIVPLVRESMLSFINSFFTKDEVLVVVDIPLLFELNLDAYCDTVVVVSAGEEEQRRRVLARGKMTEAEFEKIKAAQMSDADKRIRTDLVINTNCPLEETRARVSYIVGLAQ